MEAEKNTKPATENKKTILGLTLIITVLALLFLWSGTRWQQVFQGADAQGYYRYLPQVFIKHTLHDQDTLAPYMRKVNGQNVNKYPIGPALVWAPFFGLAQAFAKFSHPSPTIPAGYTRIHAVFISTAAIFTIALGLWALTQILLWFKISTQVISFSLVVVTFGTNLFYYAVFLPSMSHIYTFGFASLFLYLLIVKPHKANLLGFVFGLLVVIRPTNILLLLLAPLTSFPSLTSTASLTSFTPLTLLTNRKSPPNLSKFIFASIFFLVPIFLQLLCWKLQTQHWFIWSYPGEGFYWSHPAIFEGLFGFRKGFFLYTPIMFLVLILSVLSFKFYFRATLIFLTYLGAMAYVVTSWWCWSYESSFGNRAFIDTYPVWTILLAFSLQSFNQTNKRITILKVVLPTLIILAVLLNLFQAYQYRLGILNSFCMNKDKYSYTLLKWQPKYKNCLGGNEDLPLYSEKPPICLGTFKQISDSLQAFSTFPTFPTSPNYNPEWLVIDLDRTEKLFGSSVNCKFIVETQVFSQPKATQPEANQPQATQSQITQYTFLLNETPAEPISKHYHYLVQLPLHLVPKSEIKCYITYLDSSKVQIKNWKILAWKSNQ